MMITARQVSKGKLEVTLHNPDDAPLAFFNRLSIVNPTTHQRLLPTFYSDNYVSVLPGSEKKIVIDYPEKNTGIQLEVSGWNLKRQIIEVKM